jgi:hypothetical protein
LKILGIYFAMHYLIFWLWVLYNDTYFAIHYRIFWLWANSNTYDEGATKLYDIGRDKCDLFDVIDILEVASPLF